jgi:hypothetical protein
LCRAIGGKIEVDALVSEFARHAIKGQHERILEHDTAARFAVAHRVETALHVERVIEADFTTVTGPLELTDRFTH